MAPPNLTRAQAAAVERSRERLDRALAAASSPETRRAYAGDLRAWDRWCTERAVNAERPSPGALAAFAVAQAPSTGRRRAGTVIRALGLPPRYRRAVTLALKGHARTSPPVQRAAPILPEHLVMLSHDPPRHFGGILVGWHGALRRSELAGAEVLEIGTTYADLRVQAKGGAWQTVHLLEARYRPCCAVHWLREHGQLPELTAGQWDRVVRAAGRRLGQSWSAHSLRRGWATAASRSGMRASTIKAHGRWRSAGVALAYQDAAEVLRDLEPLV